MKRGERERVRERKETREREKGKIGKGRKEEERKIGTEKGTGVDTTRGVGTVVAAKNKTAKIKDPE